MKTVCIISDTHGSLNPKVLECIDGCDNIIHAGDIGNMSIVEELKEIAPVTAILGNNDDSFLFRGISYRMTSVEIEDVVFAIDHRPNQLDRDLPDVLTYYTRKFETLPKIIGIHGHKHVPRIATGTEAKPADLIVCPGSVTAPREGWVATFAKVVVNNGEVEACEIHNLKDEVVLRLDQPVS